VQQLLTGATTGPLSMDPPAAPGAAASAAAAAAAAGAPAASSAKPGAPIQVPARPGETGFELPLPLVAVAVLVATTASALWLGGAKPAELALIAVVWAVAGVLVALRRREVRRRR
jgi:hypothetical protein